MVRVFVIFLSGRYSTSYSLLDKKLLIVASDWLSGSNSGCSHVYNTQYVSNFSPSPSKSNNTASSTSILIIKYDEELIALSLHIVTFIFLSSTSSLTREHIQVLILF